VNSGSAGVSSSPAPQGSSVRGYSYLIYARRAQQTADSVDNFIM